MDHSNGGSELAREEARPDTRYLSEKISMKKATPRLMPVS
jgi:hypothetical protein